jgi:hypothetical protein
MPPKLAPPQQPKSTDKKKQISNSPIPELVHSNAANVNEVLPKSDLLRIGMKQLLFTLQPMISPPNSTPLLIDPTQRVDIYFTYSAEGAIFIEAKKYVIATFITKTMTLFEALEDMRKLLIQAMKQGKPLVIQMTDSAADFNHVFTSKDCFPEEVFQLGGSKLYRKEYFTKVVREQELDNGSWVTKAGFFVVVTTMFDPRIFSMYLKKSLPLKHLTPIYIEPPASTDIGFSA